MLISFDTDNNGFILSRGKDNLSGTELSTSLGKLISQYRDVLMVASHIPWYDCSFHMTFSSSFGNVSFKCYHINSMSHRCVISLSDVTCLNALFDVNSVDYQSVFGIVSKVLEESYYSYMTSIFRHSFKFDDEFYGRISGNGYTLKAELHQNALDFIYNKISYSRVGACLELHNFDFIVIKISDRSTFTLSTVCDILETILYLRDRFLSNGISYDVIVRGVGSIYPVDYFTCCRGKLVSLLYDRRNSNTMYKLLSDGSTSASFSVSINDDYITFSFLINVKSSIHKVMGSSFFDVNKFFSVLERSVFEFGEFVGCHM